MKMQFTLLAVLCLRLVVGGQTPTTAALRASQTESQHWRKTGNGLRASKQRSTQQLKYILMAFFIFMNLSGYAQGNFIANSSFETHIQCPHQWDEISLAIPWDTLKMGSCGIPELMSECDTINGYCNVPFAFGYQYAKTGKSYMSMWIYIDAPATFTPRRDYAQIKLKGNLVSGVQYCVTGYVSLTNRSEIAIDNIGFYFDDGSIHAPNQTWALATPQVQSPTGVFMTDTLNWMKIQGSFVANGIEKYLSIGNFKSDSLTDTLHVKPLSIYTLAEYNIDDVSVLESNSKIFAGNDTAITKGDTIELGKTTTEGLPCEWYDMIGNKIGRGSIALVHPTTNTKYVVKMDLCGAVSYDTVEVFVYNVGVDEIKNEVVSIYPNPANDEFVVKLKSNSTYEICLMDLLGEQLFNTHFKSNIATINTTSFPNGIYTLQVIDRMNNKTVYRKLVIQH